MSLRNELAGVVARDPRYTFHGYVFVLEALEYSKTLGEAAARRSKGKKAKAGPRHVSGRELCEGFRRLAIEHYGMMSLAVLQLWGIRSTSDIGEVVYNLIASGELEKTLSDSRSDFDGVYDFEQAFSRDFVLALDEVA